MNPLHFSVFRILFGVFLTWHFGCLLPYANELFGGQGILSEAELNPFHGAWPNPLFSNSSRILAPLIIGLACLMSASFTLGFWRRGCALLLWYISTCLFTANPLVANPSLGYLGLLMLLCTLVPKGEPLTLASPTDTNWKMPRMIPLSAWILLATGYTFSGVLKLNSPSWVDGSALQHVLNNPLARPGIVRDAMLALPEFFLQCLTWSTLALEILFLPLVISRRIRPWAWLAMVMMHLGIMLSIDFADLSLGMLMVHLFTYQSSWLARPTTTAILFLDGDCNFCKRSVRTLSKLCPHLKFAPLQGSTAVQFLSQQQRRLRDEQGAPTGAAILIENPASNTQIYWKGPDAILRTFWLMGGPPSLLWHLHRVPQWLKKGTYQFIARRRHALPFISKQCQLPSQEEKQRYLP